MPVVLLLYTWYQIYHVEQDMTLHMYVTIMHVIILLDLTIETGHGLLRAHPLCSQGKQIRKE